jgi:hypothetical protein
VISVPVNATQTGSLGNRVTVKATHHSIYPPSVFIREKNLLSAVKMASAISSFHIVTCSASIARITRSAITVFPESQR